MVTKAGSKDPTSSKVATQMLGPTALVSITTATRQIQTVTELLNKAEDECQVLVRDGDGMNSEKRKKRRKRMKQQPLTLSHSSTVLSAVGGIEKCMRIECMNILKWKKC